jgi:hypothetical protein
MTAKGGAGNGRAAPLVGEHTARLREEFGL